MKKGCLFVIVMGLYVFIGGCKNDDGSLTLCVYAVFPNDNTSKKFVHEVTIQDENGKIIYLSNHILENQKSSFWWHADRYTDEAWKEYYGR